MLQSVTRMGDFRGVMHTQLNQEQILKPMQEGRNLQRMCKRERLHENVEYVPRRPQNVPSADGLTSVNQKSVRTNSLWCMPVRVTTHAETRWIDKSPHT